MIKKILLTFLIYALYVLPTFAKTEILITPIKKITTANNSINEGDYIDFKVLGTDEKLRGLIVKYQENGFGGIEAILVVDQFRALNSDNNYEGTIAINGNQHNQIMEFFSGWAIYIRGGEVTILPDKDIFTLWRI